MRHSVVSERSPSHLFGVLTIKIVYIASNMTTDLAAEILTTQSTIQSAINYNIDHHNVNHELIGTDFLLLLLLGRPT